MDWGRLHGADVFSILPQTRDCGNWMHIEVLCMNTIDIVIPIELPCEIGL